MVGEAPIIERGIEPPLIMDRGQGNYALSVWELKCVSARKPVPFEPAISDAGQSLPGRARSKPGDVLRRPPKADSATGRCGLIARNLIERFFNKIRQCRRVATRYEKLAASYPALNGHELQVSVRPCAHWCSLISIVSLPMIVTPCPAKGIDSRTKSNSG